MVVMGYNNIGCRCLEFLLRRPEEVVAVFTHKDDPRENIYFDSVEEIAKSHGIPCFTPDDVNTAENVRILRELAPDVIFSFYYRQILSKEIIEIPSEGAINLHGSLLPKYRGRAPINWAIINGEAETGLTLHYISEKPDAGDIIAQGRIPIGIDDTALTLFNRMTEEAVKLLDEVLPLIRTRKVKAIPQDESKATTFGRRTAADGLIDWEAPARRVYDLVRAVTHPFPGAFTRFRGKKLYIWQAKVYAGPDINTGIKGGTIVIEDRRLMVKTGQGLLVPLKLQLEGGREMPPGDFVREFAVVSGERLHS